MTAGPGTSNRTSAAATKRTGVERSGILYVASGSRTGSAARPPIMESPRYTSDDEGHADEDGHYCPPVPPIRVRVAAVHLVEFGEVELSSAHDPVVNYHHGPDGPEEAAVANEPGEDVGAGGLEDQPGKREHTDYGGDHATCPERDVLGRQVREIEGGRDHVSRHVRRDLGYRDYEHGEDKQGGDIAGKSRDEGDRGPDRLVEDDDGRRRDRDPDKGEGRHRERESKGLPDDLRALGLRVAGEVRNVEGERDPVTYVRREAGPEERPERCVALLEFGRGREHVDHAATRDEPPDQERNATADQERCGERLEPLHALDAGQDDDELYSPKDQEGYEGVSCYVGPTAPCGCYEGVEGGSAEPGLNAEPTAGHEGPGDGREVSPPDPERGADKDRERDPVLGAGVRVQEHRDKNEDVAQ